MTHVRTTTDPGPGVYRPKAPLLWRVFVVAGLVMIVLAVTVGVAIAITPPDRAPGCGRACVPATYVHDRAPEADE